MSFRTDNLKYYNRLHKQLERKRVKPANCVKCGRSDLQIDWSNISGQYKNLDDFEALCRSCHQLHDVYHLGKKVRGNKTVQNSKTSLTHIIKDNSNYSNLTRTNYSNYSNRFVGKAKSLDSFQDLIPEDGYEGFYYRKLESLGVDMFTQLANKARSGSNTPARLFCWMLKNPHLVK